jgi:hypothetical protein
MMPVIGARAESSDSSHAGHTQAQERVASSPSRLCALALAASSDRIDDPIIGQCVRTVRIQQDLGRPGPTRNLVPQVSVGLLVFGAWTLRDFLVLA